MLQLPSMEHVSGLRKLQFFLSSSGFEDWLIMALLWLDIIDLTLFMQLWLNLRLWEVLINEGKEAFSNIFCLYIPAIWQVVP